jgi:hypothetical protein
MAKAPDMAELQAAMAGEQKEKQVEASLRQTLQLGSLQIATFGEALRHIGNVLLNVLVVALIVLGIAGISVAGDRLYLNATNTGSSKFEAYLRKQGYTEQALAYRQQQEACQDSSNALALCKGAAWLYIHPEIAVWPAKTGARDAVADVPRRRP